MQASSLSIDQLAAFCEEEQAKFKRGELNDPRYCFELFMRASTETAQQAFESIYRIFSREVENWVQRHPGFSLTDESSEWFVNAALGNFYHQMRKPSFREKSVTLGGVLQFLKMCVNSVIAESLRRKRIESSDEEDWEIIANIPELQEIDLDLAGKELWDCIRAVLSEERAQYLAYLAFELEMPPREIEKRFPNTWKDVRKHVYRIREKLRGDPDFLDCAGL